MKMTTGNLTQKNIAKKIIKLCKALHKKNLLAAGDGNISFRVSNNLILITPSGVAKNNIKVRDFAVVNIKGEVLKGKPSSELSMHLEVYKKSKKAKCVVHAHPPHAIAWTIAKPKLKEIKADAMSELILAVGSLPIVKYARPGTTQMADNISGFVCKNRAMILARHGALSWGESIEEAHRGMERLEHSCEILFKAELLGGITSLPKTEVNYLKQIRTKMGPISL